MFRPPFCPHKECTAHIEAPSGRWWIKIGSYSTRCHGRVQRYRCRRCGRSFSRQTFDLEYYAKRRISYRRLQKHIRSCAGVRQTALNLGVHRSTVLNKIMRLSRQAIAVHAEIVGNMQLREDLAADGLESYWVSQYLPNNFNVLLGAESRFLFDWDTVTLRRSGRMTAGQQRRREEIEKRYRPDPKAVQVSFGRLLDTAGKLAERSVQPLTVLSTDCHRAYGRALKEHEAWQCLEKRGKVFHRIISSRKARTSANPLNPVNTFDRQVRNDMAEHVRETIRFARNRALSLERCAIHAFDYNYVKRFRINQPAGDATTHAQAAGVPGREVRSRVESMYTDRRFFSRSVMSKPMRAVWLRSERTPLKESPEYLPAYLAA
jgi:transposase-like protein